MILKAVYFKMATYRLVKLIPNPCFVQKFMDCNKLEYFQSFAFFVFFTTATLATFIITRLYNVASVSVMVHFLVSQ